MQPKPHNATMWAFSVISCLLLDHIQLLVYVVHTPEYKSIKMYELIKGNLQKLLIAYKQSAQIKIP